MSAPHREDPRLSEAKGIPIMDVADKLQLDLRRAGREFVGPCPRPGCGGTDRFSINPDKDLFNCRACGGDGMGCDQIGLVRLVLGLTFPEALTWMVGDRPASLTPEQERARVRERARAKAARDRKARRARERAIDDARAIWSAGIPATQSSIVAGYLRARGINPRFLGDPLPQLRLHANLPYMLSDGPGKWREVHRGPAMLAACLAPDRKLMAVHRTWIDLSRPKGKAVICGADGAPLLDDKGKPLKVKKTLGSLRRTAIRLMTPAKFHTLVMGEGIETTLSAAYALAGQQGVAFWAGISLGHMAGRRNLRGKGSRYAGLPDLEDADAWLPPPWIRRLVFLQDGDSDPKTTRAKLMAGLRRAGHHIPGLNIQIAHAGEGADFNDVLMGAADG